VAGHLATADREEFRRPPTTSTTSYRSSSAVPSGPAVASGRWWCGGSARRLPGGLDDQVGDRAGPGHGDGVGGVDLDGRGPRAPSHEDLRLGRDREVLAGDQGPGRDRPPCRRRGLLLQRLTGDGPLRRDHQFGDLRGDVRGEHPPELLRPDVQVGHRAAVGVAGQHHRAVHPVQDAAQLLGVAAQAPERVGHGDDRVTGAPEPLDHPVPARGLGGGAVHEHHGELVPGRPALAGVDGHGRSSRSAATGTSGRPGWGAGVTAR
jgi:hypothetical protein